MTGCMPPPWRMDGTSAIDHSGICPSTDRRTRKSIGQTATGWQGRLLG